MQLQKGKPKKIITLSKRCYGQVKGRLHKCKQRDGSQLSIAEHLAKLAAKFKETNTFRHEILTYNIRMLKRMWHVNMSSNCRLSPLSLEILCFLMKERRYLFRLFKEMRAVAIECP